ncbi:hypothetical protein DPMN_053601 [Dreissena polymorpha]|uniref:Uncharacterized protein n=1 Tax=Dreissena polymorpha TaxID=45954 RepID=A0A9D4HQU2_DREPO|nr:hypothetical protein DPMN_053601 [Dreissena polymorpha]
MFKKYKEDEQEEELPWLEVLDRVEAMELWGGRKRETREPWCHYLTKADEILKMPRQTIPEVNI